MEEIEQDFIFQNIIAIDSINILKKLYRASVVFLTMDLVYALLAFFELSRIVRLYSISTIQNLRSIYFYRIYPFAISAILLLGLFNGIFLLKGYRHLADAIENKEAGLIKKSFNAIFIAMLLIITSYCIAVLNIICRLSIT